MNNSTIRLDGKKILITGVSRPLGIGATLAKRFAEAGAAVAIHGYSKYDLTVGEHNSATPNGTEILAKQYQDMGLNVTLITPSDFEKHGTATKTVEEAAEKMNGLDGLILNHCYGVYSEIDKWTEEDIDAHLSVNVRASMMMIKFFSEQVDSSKDNAITTFSSGQYYEIETDLMSYSVSKDAIVCLTRGTAKLLGSKNIRVNCINPGPNDTGYYPGDTSRWCTPNDAADLVLFLHSSYARCITGHLIASDKGHRLTGDFLYS
jgi:3-oxoacyl-[acyl-carrier protein] reductase